MQRRAPKVLQIGAPDTLIEGDKRLKILFSLQARTREFPLQGYFLRSKLKMLLYIIALKHTRCLHTHIYAQTVYLTFSLFKHI